MLLGLASVACSNGSIRTRCLMILWGVLLDKLDGSAARLLNASSNGADLIHLRTLWLWYRSRRLFYFKLETLGLLEGLLRSLLLATCGLACWRGSALGTVQRERTAPW